MTNSKKDPTDIAIKKANSGISQKRSELLKDCMMNLSLELPLDDMFGKLQKDIEDA